MSNSYYFDYKCNLLVVDRPGAVDIFDRDVLVTDFGLSVYFEAASYQQGSMRGGIFLAPEQRDPEMFGLDIDEGDRPTAQSDIFTLAPLCIQVRLSIHHELVSKLIQRIAVHRSPPLVWQTLSNPLPCQRCGLPVDDASA